MLTFPVLESHWRVFGLSVHSGIPLPSPARAPLVHFELPHTMKWVDRGSFTTAVTFDGFHTALQGHDVGKLIVHVSVPPANPLLPVTILASACTVRFAASHVTAEGTPVGTYFPFLMPPVECTDNKALIPLSVIVPFPCTVVIGMTPAQIVAGWAHVVADILVEKVCAKVFDRATAAAGRAMGRWAQQASGRLSRTLLGPGAQQAAGAAVERAREAARDNPVAAAMLADMAQRAQRRARSGAIALARNAAAPATQGVDFTAGMPHAD